MCPDASGNGCSETHSHKCASNGQCVRSAGDCPANPGKITFISCHPMSLTLSSLFPLLSFSLLSYPRFSFSSLLSYPLLYFSLFSLTHQLELVAPHPPLSSVSRVNVCRLRRSVRLLTCVQLPLPFAAQTVFVLLLTPNVPPTLVVFPAPSDVQVEAARWTLPTVRR